MATSEVSKTAFALLELSGNTRYPTGDTMKFDLWWDFSQVDTAEPTEGPQTDPVFTMKFKTSDGAEISAAPVWTESFTEKSSGSTIVEVPVPVDIEGVAVNSGDKFTVLLMAADDESAVEEYITEAIINVAVDDTAPVGGDLAASSLDNLTFWEKISLTFFKWGTYIVIVGAFALMLAMGVGAVGALIVAALMGIVYWLVNYLAKELDSQLTWYGAIGIGALAIPLLAAKPLTDAARALAEFVGMGDQIKEPKAFFGKKDTKDTGASSFFG